MYVLGEILCRRGGGAWAVDDVPGSPAFARYVIDLPAGCGAGYRVDPARLAHEALVAPPGADPAPLGALVEAVLGRARGPVPCRNPA